MTLNLAAFIGNFYNCNYQYLAGMRRQAVLASCRSNCFSNIKAHLHNLHIQILIILQMCIRSYCFSHRFKRIVIYWRKLNATFSSQKVLTYVLLPEFENVFQLSHAEVLYTHLGSTSNILNLCGSSNGYLSIIWIRQWNLITSNL